MHANNFPCVIDACVLANQPVCDLLLRLAETPRLYVPLWSREILEEVKRTHIDKLNWPVELAESWRTAIEDHFPQSLVENYEKYLPLVENDPKDRHVLAAAIGGPAKMIVTFNLKHFPSAALQKWCIEASHPSEYLSTLYSIDSGVVVSKIVAIAKQRDITPERALATIAKSVPAFGQYVAESLGWELHD